MTEREENMKLEDLPLLKNKKWYRDLCREESINPDTANIDFEEKIFDGKGYVGPEIAEYYEKKLKPMSWPERGEYAANENHFCRIKNEELFNSISVYSQHKVVSAFKKTETEELKDKFGHEEFVENQYIVCFEDSIELYIEEIYICHLATGEKIDKETEIYNDFDALKNLGMISDSDWD